MAGKPGVRTGVGVKPSTVSSRKPAGLIRYRSLCGEARTERESVNGQGKKAARNRGAPGWCLSLGMHLFRKAERTGGSLLDNRPSRGEALVKKSRRRSWGSKVEWRLGLKSSQLSLMELPFCTPQVRRIWSGRRFGKPKQGGVLRTANAVALENPKVYRGLQVSSSPVKREISQGYIGHTVCPVPWESLRILWGLGRDCPMDTPESKHRRETNVHFYNVPARYEIIGHKWFVEKPAEGVSRRVNRSWWWLAKKVKNMPEEMRTGNVRKDDSRLLGLFRKFRLGSLLQVKRLRRQEWRTVGPTTRDEMISILRRLPVRRERWKRRRRR